MKVGESMDNSELLNEISALKSFFPGADDNKLKALEGLIEQAAYERLYLKQLNKQALNSGLVMFHPENATLQRTLPISSEITKHSATLTNIMDKLMRHLAVNIDDEDDDLNEYE